MGFESEWSDGLLAMLPLLYDKELLGSTELHAYHCDCSDCFNINQIGAYDLRAQRDSSCNGELISRVFRDGEDGLDIMTAIQDASVEVDAVPGMNAGFHVHVSASHLLDTERRATVWEWLRWEPTMMQLACGAFRQVRGFNPSLRSTIIPLVTCSSWARNNRNIYDRYNEFSRSWRDVYAFIVEHPSRDGILADVVYWAENADRHRTLCTHTRYNTFEFRLWNSTRSAWRMDLWVKLSRLWMEPEFVTALSTIERTDDRQANLEAFLAALPADAALLADQQYRFMQDHANDPDPVFALAG